MAKYTDLFGLEGPVDSGVTDWAEHGRAGNVSTGQPFKHVSLIDPSTGNSLITDGKLDVNATVTATIDPTGLATDTNQTNGSQKTQIVDAGGEAVTVTGGKLDVNASIDTTGLATTTTDTNTGTIAGDTTSIDAKIPALGQALAAGSVPVVLTAAQVSTLTPLSTVAVTQSGTWDEVGINDSGNSITIDYNGSAISTSNPLPIQPPASGALPVSQSGTWNITNVSGTVSLPTGAATSAKQDNLLNEIYVLTGAMAMQVDDAGSGTIYQGWADPGTATSAASWRVRKIVSSGTPEDTTITWADGNRNFDNVWNSRASLSYS